MTCPNCGAKITDTDFMDDEGNVLCEDCYEIYLEKEEEQCLSAEVGRTKTEVSFVK